MNGEIRGDSAPRATVLDAVFSIVSFPAHHFRGHFVSGSGGLGTRLSFPDPVRRRIKWRPADRVGYETKPNVCTKQRQAKQSYHFTVAVTISAVEDLDTPRKNATAKNRRTKESQLDRIPEYMRKGTYSRNRALCSALLRETMAWKTRRHGQLRDFFRGLKTKSSWISSKAPRCD